MIPPLMELAPPEKRTRLAGVQIATDYGHPDAEYAAARSGAALRDASHWPLVRLSGRDHLDFLHRMTTGNFRDLQPGDGTHTVFPDQRGRLVWTGVLTRVGADQTLGVLCPGGDPPLPEWLERFHFSEDLALDAADTDSRILEVVGATAAAVAGRHFDVDLGAVAPGCLLGTVEGPLHLVRHDQYGYPGLRLIAAPDVIDGICLDLLHAGLPPLGETAAEMLRIESGTPGSAELTDDYNPWEAVCGLSVHANKGCYIGQEVIARLEAYDKVKQSLMGLRLPPGSDTETGVQLYSDDRPAGLLTSLTLSPALDCPIALAYVRRHAAAPGTEVAVGSAAEGRAPIGAVVTDLPFVDPA